MRGVVVRIRGVGILLGDPVSGAQSQLEVGMFGPWHQVLFLVLLHHPYGNDETVGADFRDYGSFGIDIQTQQLECTALGQVLLELAVLGRHFLGLPSAT